YYGPTIKQIFEEHHRVRRRQSTWTATTTTPASWESLRDAMLRIVHGAISGMTAPTLNLTAYAGAPPELQQRVRQLGSLIDDISPGKIGLSSFRNQLESFFATYASELEERGFPLWHPLPFQFPDDPESALHAD